MKKNDKNMDRFVMKPDDVVPVSKMDLVRDYKDYDDLLDRLFLRDTNEATRNRILGNLPQDQLAALKAKSRK